LQWNITKVCNIIFSHVWLSAGWNGEYRMVFYGSLYLGLSYGFVDESFQVWLKSEVNGTVWGKQCIFAPTSFLSSHVSKEDKGVGQNTSYIHFLTSVICKEVSLWLFAVYRKSKGGCEVGPTSAQYTSAAAHLFGWRTYHPSWHWCCLYIVAAVSVCSRHKLQVSSLLLIEVCHPKFYITHFLCYCNTFTEDQNLLVVQYSFVFVVRPSKPVGGLTVDKRKYCATVWFWSFVMGHLHICTHVNT